MITPTWSRREKILLSALVIVIITLGYFFIISKQDKSSIQSSKTMESYQPSVKKETDTSSKKNPTLIVVDVKGQVKKPGIYQLKVGARLYQAVAKAQGLNANADVQRVNLAEKLQDGMAIYIPKKGEKLTNSSIVSNTGNEQDGKKININTATVEELQELNGLGPAKAQAIVEYREKQGPFGQIEQITEVPGIGEKTLAKFRDQIIF